MSFQTMHFFLLQNTNTNVGDRTVLVPIDFHCIFEAMGTVQNIYLYVPQKKIIQVWSNIRGSKWQSFIFGWTIPLNEDKCNRKLSVCTTIIFTSTSKPIKTIEWFLPSKYVAKSCHIANTISFCPWPTISPELNVNDAYDLSSMNKRWMAYRPTGRVVNSLSDPHLPLWSYCGIRFKDNWAGTKGWCITFNMYLWI